MMQVHKQEKDVALTKNSTLKQRCESNGERRSVRQR